MHPGRGTQLRCSSARPAPASCRQRAARARVPRHPVLHRRQLAGPHPHIGISLLVAARPGRRTARGQRSPVEAAARGCPPGTLCHAGVGRGRPRPALHAAQPSGPGVEVRCRLLAVCRLLVCVQEAVGTVTAGRTQQAHTQIILPAPWNVQACSACLPLVDGPAPCAGIPSVHHPGHAATAALPPAVSSFP